MSETQKKLQTEIEAEYMEQIAFMFKKAEERYAEQQRNPDPLADRLIDACTGGRVGEVKWLLHKKNVSPNVVRVYGTPVGSAVLSANPLEVLTELSQAAANLDLQDQNGWSALFIASGNDRVEVIRHLATLGVNLNLPCPNNHWTALINAACGGYSRSVIELLTHGADATTRTIDNLTALDIASTNQHFAVVRILRKYFEILGRR